MEDPFEPPFATVFDRIPVEDEDEMRELWEDPTMLLLARLLYRHPDRSVLEQKFFKLQKQNEAVKTLIRKCIEVENPSDLLLCMYWYEFKHAREDFKMRYRTAIRLFEENKMTAASALFTKLRYNKGFDKELAKENMSRAVSKLLETERPQRPELNLCNICMNAFENACLIHESRGCKVCKSCSKWFESGKRCPFCRKVVERVVLLNGV
jgi:hypothetical protein